MPVMTQQTHDQIEINKNQISSLNNFKVDKVVGRGLSQEDFTTALMQKLNGIEGSHFKGTHMSLVALELAFPATAQEEGSYAYIKSGNADLKMALLDEAGHTWEEFDTGHTDLTAAQIKVLYESNLDTEVLTTAMRNVLSHIYATKPFNADVMQDAFNAFMPSEGKAILKGHLPTMDMLIKTGGSNEAVMNVINEANGGRIVAQFLYANEQMILRLKNPTTGTITNELVLSADGMVSSLTSGDMIKGFDNLLTAKMMELPMRTKADVNYVNKAVINTYAGLAEPDIAIGKTGDKYHRYTQAVEQTFITGKAFTGYHPQFFELFYDSHVSVGIIGISIDPPKRIVYIDYAGLDEHSENPKLVIDGTEIPLTDKHKTEGNYEGTYTASFDNLIASIVANVTPFELKAEVLSGKEEDYTKFDGEWYFTPVIDQTYDWVTAGINNGGNPIIIKSNTFVPVANLVVTDIRKAGVYQITFTTTFKYSVANKSAIFRWSLDGGVNWKVINHEVKDKTNDEIISYTFPKQLQPGQVDFKMEAKCESSSNTLTIDFAHITMERKK